MKIYSAVFSLVFVLTTWTGWAQEITFTSHRLSKDQTTIKAAQGSFKASEGIYGVAKMAMPIVQTTVDGTQPGNYVHLGYFVKIDGVPVVSKRKGMMAEPVEGAMFTRFVGGGEMYEQDRLSFVLLADPKHPKLSDPEVSGPSKEFLKGLRKAGKGNHQVEVELRYLFDGKISQPLASGRITVDAQNLPAQDMDGDLPAAKMSDPGLVASMKSALVKGKWKYQVLKINIVESKWEIHRNSFGRITHRSIDTYVAFRTDASTCKAYNISFRQNYDGQRYGATQVNGVGENFEISPAKLGR